MRKMQKVVLVFMGIFSIILASGCGDYGTVTTNTLKATVLPKSAPEKKFDVEITKDLDNV